MLAVLTSVTVQPSHAQTRDQGERETVYLEEVAPSIRELPAAPYKNFNFLVKGDAGDHVRYGERHSIDDFGIEVLDPPPPVPFHVWIWLADWGVLLDCVYDDDTGELLYCDIYA